LVVDVGAASIERVASTRSPELLRLASLDLALIGPERSRAETRPLLISLAGSPEAVERVEDTVVEQDGLFVPIRTYWPSAPGPHPLLLFFHGGGYVFGDLDTHDATVRALTNRAGVVSISVDYRLAPEHPFPAAIDDCLAVLRWASTHAADLNADAARIALVGDSAGGNLAAVAARVARDEGLSVCFQLLFYPLIDGDTARPSYARDTASRRLIEWSVLCYGAPHNDPLANPLAVDDLHGLPPGLAIVASNDILAEEGAAYVSALRGAGVAMMLERCEGVPHLFIGMPIVFKQAITALECAGAALRAALCTSS
jgi:acetyl esterase